MANRLRVLSAADQNYRITQGTGLVTNDGIFTFAAADSNAGANPNLAPAASLNSFIGGTPRRPVPADPSCRGDPPLAARSVPVCPRRDADGLC